KNMLLSECFYAFFGTQNVATNWVILKNEFFKIVKNQFGGTVLIAQNFIQNYILFFRDFLLRENRIQSYISYCLYRTLKMGFQEGGIDNCFFFCGISIQLGANTVHTVENMKSFTPFCTFKETMLNKMSQTLFIVKFIARSGIYGKAKMSSLTICHRLENYPNSV